MAGSIFFQSSQQITPLENVSNLTRHLMFFRYSSAKLHEGILLFGDAGGSVFCLKFCAITGCMFDLNLAQQIPSGQRYYKYLTKSHDYE